MIGNNNFAELGGLLPPDLRIEVHFNSMLGMWVANFTNGHQIREFFADDLRQDCIEYISTLAQSSGELYGEPVRQAYEPEPEGDES